MAVEDEPAQSFSQTLEVKEYQRLARVDPHLAVLEADLVVLD
jgi:hypothetical protein